MADVPTKQQLIEALRKTGDELTSKVRSIDAHTLQRGVYENGWNAKQILAHVASIEWTYPKLIDMAARSANGDAPSSPATGASRAPSRTTADGAATTTAQPAILSYNDRQVEKRANASIEELLTEFEKNRAVTIAAVESVDEELLGVSIRSAGGITGPLASVIDAVAVQHVSMHAADIVGETWSRARF